MTVPRLRVRKLTLGETALARSVFGEALDLKPVRLWFHGLPTRFAMTLGPVITMPGAVRPDFSAEGAEIQAWLIHELVHVWQMQTAPRRAIASWAKVLLSGGYGPALPGYRYALPARWDALNLEQQAALVEDMMRLSAGRRPRHGPATATLVDYRGMTPFGAAPPLGSTIKPPPPAAGRSGRPAGL